MPTGAEPGAAGRRGAKLPPRWTIDRRWSGDTPRARLQESLAPTRVPLNWRKGGVKRVSLANTDIQHTAWSACSLIFSATPFQIAQTSGSSKRNAPLHPGSAVCRQARTSGTRVYPSLSACRSQRGESGFAPRKSTPTLERLATAIVVSKVPRLLIYIVGSRC